MQEHKMQIKPGSAELFLKKNQPISMRTAKNLKITCTEGIIWITVSGERNDIFLARGDHFVLANNNLTLIESIDEGKIHLTKPQHFTWLERWTKKPEATPSKWLTFVS
jgi:hypothetical protein